MTHKMKKQIKQHEFTFKSTCGAYEEIKTDIAYGGILFIGEFSISHGDFRRLLKWYERRTNREPRAHKVIQSKLTRARKALDKLWNMSARNRGVIAKLYGTLHLPNGEL